MLVFILGTNRYNHRQTFTINQLSILHFNRMNPQSLSGACLVESLPSNPARRPGTIPGYDQVGPILISVLGLGVCPLCSVLCSV